MVPPTLHNQLLTLLLIPMLPQWKAQPRLIDLSRSPLQATERAFSSQISQKYPKL